MLDTDSNQLAKLVGMVLVNFLPTITKLDRIGQCSLIAMEVLPQKYRHWDANVSLAAIGFLEDIVCLLAGYCL
jgi:hypothetical protein